jgi:hypothetical protein
MDFSTILKSVRTQFAEHGLAGLSRMLLNRTYLRFQEWKYDIHTNVVISSSALGLANPEHHDYGASDWRHLRKVIERLGLQHESHTFVDFGAGLGRVLIVAGGFPFDRVIGVELSRELASLAQQNLTRARRKLVCKDVRVVNTDAAQFTIEPEMSIFYFFNPFHGQTLQIVLNAIHRSLTSSPRVARIICRLPPTSEFEVRIQECDWLERQFELRLKNGTKYWVFASRLSAPLIP